MSTRKYLSLYRARPFFVYSNLCKRLSLFALVLLSCNVYLSAQDADPKRYPLIPYPQHIETGAGDFIIDNATGLVAPEMFSNELKQFQEIISAYLGRSLHKVAQPGKGTIVFAYDPKISEAEGYQLKITREEIRLAASTPTGIFRGIETIKQLLPVITNQDERLRKSLKLPVLDINDAPTWEWRGLHIDVARHFFSINYLRKMIDLLAFYKMNKLHLHLTDDQGWRIEIKKYPLLTQQGAWRTFNNQDSTCIEKSKDNPDMALDEEHIVVRNGKKMYGGFYTQEQMRDLIKYAAARHVEIIPEIDMPGHMMAAINAYPYLTCSSQKGWGKDFSTPVCPCNEQALKFAEDVFTEIAALFPSKYIHLGADEVEKTSWAKSEACAALMKENGLKSVNELQSWFVKYMEKFFNAKGKQLIGWDEILEGGVSSTAVVMYWRSWVPKAPIEAAQHGNKVIMTPGNPLYFDVLPDRNSLSKVYHFEPIPKVLTPEQSKFIIGAQANTWTENIPSEKRADYMIMPRLTALAEVLWTHHDRFDNYMDRLLQHYTILDAKKVHYRMPDLEGFTEENVYVDRGTLKVFKPLKEMTLHYTLDSSIPTVKSPVLPDAFSITRPQTIRFAAFSPSGNRGDIYTVRYKQQAYQHAVIVADLQPGLTLDLYKRSFKRAAIIEGNKDTSFIVNNINAPDIGMNGKPFGAKLYGYINVPETGVYSFFLTCDDGGNLNIDGNEVINNDGWHYPIVKSGQVALEKGLHRIEVPFVEGGGGYTLKLEYSFDGSKVSTVPDEWFSHK